MLDLAKLNQRIITAGLTPTELAALVGISKQRMYDITSGRKPNVTVKTLDRLATALRVNPCYLLKAGNNE
jgi:DNA-binding Xre family transcriptional regulator